MTKREKAIKAEVKRINTRISAIGKQFGTESTYYKRTIKEFLPTTFEKLIHKNERTGIIQINTNVETIKHFARTDDELLGIARRTVKTISHIRKSLGLESKKIKTKDVIKKAEEQAKKEEEFETEKMYLYKNYDEQEQHQMFPELWKDGRTDSATITKEQYEKFLLKIRKDKVINIINMSVNLDETTKQSLIEKVKNTTDFEMLKYIQNEMDLDLLD